MEKENLSTKDMSNVLNKNSGVLGISGVSSDFRDIEEAANNGNERAKLAQDVFSTREKKYIASYAAVMQGLDVLVFTAGIGENSIELRAKICEGLGFLGIDLDAEKNKVRGKETLAQKEGARVKILIIPTNEELMIARDAVSLSKKQETYQ